MGHSNIYIRKDNETKWDNIPDKSAWVNDMIAKSGAKEIFFERTKPSELTDSKMDKVINDLRDKVVKPNNVKPCKHGYPPTTCKFAKPGKPCKL